MGTQFALLLLLFSAAVVMAHAAAGSMHREGTVRVPGLLAGLGFFSRGRVMAVVWVYRPGRVYFRFSFSGG